MLGILTRYRQNWIIQSDCVCGWHPCCNTEADGTQIHGTYVEVVVNAYNIFLRRPTPCEATELFVSTHTSNVTNSSVIM